LDSSSEELGTFWKLWNVFITAGVGFLVIPGAPPPAPALKDPDMLCEFLKEAAPMLCRALRYVSCIICCPPYRERVA